MTTKLRQALEGLMTVAQNTVDSPAWSANVSSKRVRLREAIAAGHAALAEPDGDQCGVCPNCGYGPVIALPAPPDGEREQAWDAGYDAGWKHHRAGPSANKPRNPYRARAEQKDSSGDSGKDGNTPDKPPLNAVAPGVEKTGLPSGTGDPPQAEVTHAEQLVSAQRFSDHLARELEAKDARIVELEGELERAHLAATRRIGELEGELAAANRKLGWTGPHSPAPAQQASRPWHPNAVGWVRNKKTGDVAKLLGPANHITDGWHVRSARWEAIWDWADFEPCDEPAQQAEDRCGFVGVAHGDIPCRLPKGHDGSCDCGQAEEPAADRLSRAELVEALRSAVVVIRSGRCIEPGEELEMIADRLDRGKGRE